MIAIWQTLGKDNKITMTEDYKVLFIPIKV